MKKILFVDHTPFIGGAELVLVEHIRHLDKRAFEPLVACTPDVPELTRRFEEAGATVFHVPMERLRVWNVGVAKRLVRSVRHLRRVIAENRVDLVVSNTSRAAYVASLAIVGTGIPLVWSVRDFLYSRAVFRLFAGIPARIVCVSRAIQTYYGGETPSSSVIYVGSSLHAALGEITEEAVEAERARWGISKAETVVGFMGRVVADKGPEDLVAAARELKTRHPEARFLIVGTGRNQDGDVEESLREAVAREGLTNVSFAGHQGNEALYYRLMDIFVLTTRTAEPYATSVVQAMMAGKPVVATRNGGTPELVRHGETGLLVAPGRPDELAAAIGTLLKDRELSDRVARAGQAYVLEHNREEAITGQYEALYHSLLGVDGTPEAERRARPDAARAR